MAKRPEDPSRREFLKVVGAAALTTPFFVTLGARAAEQSPFERAQRYLGNAQELVSRAREAEGQARLELATEARTELTEARTAAMDATAAERKELRDPMEAAGRAIDQLLDD